MTNKGIILFTAIDAAKFYISHFTKDQIAIKIGLFNKKKAEIIGKENLLKLLEPYMANRDLFFEIEGLKRYFEIIGIKTINHTDPIDGTFCYEPFITFL